MANPEYKTKIDLLREGTLIKVYGSKTFVNIAGAYNIGKVRFTVVDIGTQGQNPIDIYLNIEEVRQFIDDVDKGIAKKKIDADTGNYPTAYQWVKGNEGCKKLIIGGGQKGIRVQAADSSSGKTINKFAVIQHSDLKELSFFFKLTTGIISVKEGSYYDSLYKAFKENEAKWTTKYNEATDADYAEKEELKKDATFVVKEKKFVKNGGYTGLPVIIKETGKANYLVFSAGDAETDWFKKFEAAVMSAETMPTFKAETSPIGKNLKFEKFVK